VCQTQTAKPARTCSWTIPVCDTPSGGRLGFLRVTVAGKSDYYRVQWLEQDDMQVVLAVSKELADGTFADAYRVVLPAPGCFGRPVCSCPGWFRYGKCRHGDSLTAILSRGL
jgi:hypothetical protein